MHFWLGNFCNLKELVNNTQALDHGCPNPSFIWIKAKLKTLCNLRRLGQPWIWIQNLSCSIFKCVEPTSSCMQHYSEFLNRWWHQWTKVPWRIRQWHIHKSCCHQYFYFICWYWLLEFKLWKLWMSNTFRLRMIHTIWVIPYENGKTSSKSYTGYIKYIERIQNVDAPIGEDYKITCKSCNQIFSDVELTEQYSINFYGGFRHISTETFHFETRSISTNSWLWNKFKWRTFYLIMNIKTEVINKF